MSTGCHYLFFNILLQSVLIILHSNEPVNVICSWLQAYMRYIEGLSVDSDSMCDWQTELSSSQDIFPGDSDEPDPDPLSLNGSSWLGRLVSQDSPSHTIDTIFALRDFMLQEALNVVKVA